MMNGRLRQRALVSHNDKEIERDDVRKWVCTINLENLVFVSFFASEHRKGNVSLRSRINPQ